MSLIDLTTDNRDKLVLNFLQRRKPTPPSESRGQSHPPENLLLPTPLINEVYDAVAKTEE